MPASQSALDVLLGSAWHVQHAEFIKKVGYTTNAGSPNGSLTPDHVGQICFDSTNLEFYIAKASTNTSWVRFGLGTPAVVLTALSTLVAADSGKTFYIDNATGFVTTLPAVFLGARLTFINATANTSGNHTLVSAASGNIIKGNQNSVAGDAGDFGTADDTISFVANSSIAGDKVDLWSDGTSWFAYAISKVAAGITFTQAS